MNDEHAGRQQGEAEAQEDLELRDEDAADVAGGATNKADGTLDAGIHFKYDIKAQKEG